MYHSVPFGSMKEKMKKSTRLYSAWRKWTSETHADSFGPHCFRFYQCRSWSWQPTNPHHKLASRLQGGRIAFLSHGKIKESSVYPLQDPVGLPHRAPSCSYCLPFAISLPQSLLHTIPPHAKHHRPGFPSEWSDCLQLGCIENILILCRRLEQTNYIILQLHSFHPTDVFISFPLPRLA